MKKIYIVILTLILLITSLTGCRASENITLYSTLRDLAALKTNSFNTEIKLMYSEEEAVQNFGSNASIFKNADNEYILNIKVDGKQKISDNLIKADIMYQLGDMQDYDVLTDVILKDNFIYINAEMLISTLDKIIPEYHYYFLSYLATLNSKYVKTDYTNYVTSDSNETTEFEDGNVLAAGFIQIVNLMEKEFNEIEPSVTSKSGDSYILDINETNIEKVLKALSNALKNVESYYDQFINGIENDENIKLSTVEQYKNNKEEFILKCSSYAENIDKSISDLEKYKNIKLKVEVNKTGEEEGVIKSSYNSNAGTTFNIICNLSNKQYNIEIPEDAQELGELIH